MKIKSLSPDNNVTFRVGGSVYSLQPGTFSPEIDDIHVHEAMDVCKLFKNKLELILEDGTSASFSYFEGIEQPVGLLDQGAVTISIDDSSRTLSLNPVSDSYIYFTKGVKVTINSVKGITWPNVNGLHIFYLDRYGVLNVAQAFIEEFITEYAIVSIIYWDLENQKHIYWADERHGIHMSDKTHLYLHRTRGAQFDRGCSLYDFIADADGSLDTHAQFKVNGGIIWDEDIEITLPPQTQFPVLYRSGTSWKRKEADNFPFIYHGQEGYTGTRIAYNKLTGSTWSLEEVDSNKFVLVHIFATNDFEHPFMAVLGFNQYGSKAEARTNAVSEIRTISGLPFAEFVPIGTVIYQTNSYANSVDAKVVSVDTGINYADHRLDSIRPGSLA